MRTCKKMTNLEVDLKYSHFADFFHNDSKSQQQQNLIVPNTKPSYQICYHLEANQFHQSVMNDLLTNFTSRFTNHHFNDIIKQLAFILSTYSHAGYNILRYFLPFPCDNTIFTNFGSQVKMIKEALTDVTKIEKMLDYLQYTKSLEKIRICLAIDAISFKTFSEEKDLDVKSSDQQTCNQPEETKKKKNIPQSEETSTDIEFLCSSDNQIEIDEENISLLNNSESNDIIDYMIEILHDLVQEDIEKVLSNLFLSLAMPIDHIELPNIVVNVLTYKHGLANEDIRIRLNHLKLYL
ncbi:hypothetical protein TRFO_38418 [Tritrichomonas foetus]|uniref:Uncharacterized protein n=1 Tax=Tritrichomonas foetus TaxID=1144522 RepID=A0A1J4J8I7_9EUKA|nr:hypothetical protein TRFO_38418 [Tritrichomonas foetus]|eukprot:OHS95494.1 hypothetical protein TRFO_38418 [Tritrichomonas foetus]